MSSQARSGFRALRRAARASAAALGREEQARRVLERLREARAAFDPASRKELRDAHALRVVLAALLREDSNAIDVGANEGAVLGPITSIASHGRHMAFEPIPHLYDGLRQRFPRVDVRHVALSDVSGMAEFAHVLDAPAYSGLRQRLDLPSGADRVERIQVRTDRLDDLLAPDFAPDLVKIDVEGAELQVMRGALSTLQRHRPFVVFEHGAGGADIYGATSREVFELLDSAGLRIFDLEGGGPYSVERFEAVFVEPIWNFLAAPR